LKASVIQLPSHPSGKKFEILLVPSEAARLYFIPFKLAYYAPRDHGKPILPDGWAPKISPLDMKLEQVCLLWKLTRNNQILPVFPISDYVEQGPEESVPFEDEDAPDQSAMANWTWLKSADIAPVVISRATIQGHPERIFGSVSVEDVVGALKKQLGDEGVFLTSEIVSFELVDGEVLQDGKLKSVGKFTMRIQIEQMEPVDFELVVKDSSIN
jgi:hypothetical protein